MSLTDRLGRAVRPFPVCRSRPVIVASGFNVAETRDRRVGPSVWHDRVVFPSTSPEAGRESWPAGPQPGPAAAATRGQPPAPRTGPATTDGDRRERGGPRRARRAGEPARRSEDEIDEPEEEVIPPVAVHRQLALTIAGFAALLGVGLVLGAQTSGPGHRLPFAIMIFGVQLLFVLAWTMAMRPPALLVVAGIGAVVAALADIAGGADRRRRPGAAGLSWPPAVSSPRCSASWFGPRSTGPGHRLARRDAAHRGGGGGVRAP